MALRLVVSLVTVATLAGCFQEEWRGFVYPNRADLTKHVEIGTFPSLEQCRSAAHDRLALSGWAEQGDYECGLNCERREGFGDMLVCKKTAR